MSQHPSMICSMQTLRLDPAMFTRDTLDLFNFQIVMTQVTSYLFVTVMRLQMVEEIIPTFGHEATPKQTGLLKKISVVNH